jgi:hypothetical protein
MCAITLLELVLLKFLSLVEGEVPQLQHISEVLQHCSCWHAAAAATSLSLLFHVLSTAASAG